MAPVIQALAEDPAFSSRVLATAQHRHLLDQVLAIFGIQPDLDLDIMRPNQDLTTLTARLLPALDQALAQEAPDLVLIQGDTTTVLTAALACFYRRIPFGHVEAGLRTGDLDNPFPEEMNRRVAGCLARWHFVPTDSARQNLLREAIDSKSIYVTGNTVIDALLSVSGRRPEIGLPLDPAKRLILVTAHRRENFGAPFREICQALLQLAKANPDVHILYPVHPNPNIQGPAAELLGGHPAITLCPPLDYLPFVGAMQRAYLILSDSGGVQEEAPALAKPVLVLRNETERPEAVAAGVVKLVGPDRARIVGEAQRLLDEPAAYRAMARGVSPYGDGHATARIIAALKDWADSGRV
ncbi:MAG: UDP-N-acetylglucosamine 2-epimerase (non-hydrolyzing) [Gammaproteobacteria bacterium]|nr:UDP-N-acetylglucosamine 2-epimerase (non-hydrolyzing) [Gammaproteobacteria bacterium]